MKKSHDHTHLTRLAAISLVVVMCLSALPMLAPSASAAVPDEFEEPGYALSDPLYSIDFTAEDPSVTLTPNGAGYEYTPNGLLVNYSGPSKTLGMAAGTSLEQKDIIRLAWERTASTTDSMRISWGFQSLDQATDRVSGTIYFRPTYTTVTAETWENYAPVEGSRKEQYISYDFLDIQSMDVLIRTDGSSVTIGINGITFEYEMARDYTRMRVYTLELGSGVAWDPASEVLITALELGDSTNCKVRYNDRLHKTITPWGYDFTYSMQIHGDDATPTVLEALRDMSIKHGLRLEFSAWMESRDTQYNMSDPDYKRVLEELRDIGWDIGLHAVTQDSRVAEYLIPLIAEFQRDFQFNSWIDHGGTAQQINDTGSDPTSPYYMLDWLLANGIMIWANDRNHSHAVGNDLNRFGVYYTHEYFGQTVPLVHSSNAMFYNFIAVRNSPEYNTVDSYATQFSGWASDRAVIIYHEYADRFVYHTVDGVNYAGTTYSIFGYDYVPRSTLPEYGDARAMNEHPATIIPALDLMLSGMNEYRVWKATPYEIYQRDYYVSRVTVDETASDVTLTNPTSTSIPGFTLYTKERPDYALKCGDKTYYAAPGNCGWHFVIDELPRGQALQLTKVAIGDNAPSVRVDSVGLSLWTDSSRIYAHAIETGEAHIDPAVDYTDFMVLDSAGARVQSSGSLIWSAVEGVTYSIQSESGYRQEQIDRAMSPLYAAIPVVVVLAVLSGLITMVGRLKF